MNSNNPLNAPATLNDINTVVDLIHQLGELVHNLRQTIELQQQAIDILAGKVARLEMTTFVNKTIN